MAAVADVEPRRCAAVAPGVAAYGSSAELAAARGIDAVIIATPASAHLADAQAVSGAGLPSLIEKPPAADARQARLLAGLVPMPWIAFNRRFDPAFGRLRAPSENGASLRLRLTFDYRRKSWHAYVVDDEPLLDIGTHLLDLARWLTASEIVRLRARRLEATGCTLELELDRASATLSCNSNRPYRERVEVRDSAGSLLASEVRGGFVQGVAQRLVRSRPQPLVESLAAQLRAFGAALREGVGDGLATSLDGVAVMEAVDAARESAARSGEWVDVRAGPGG